MSKEAVYRFVSERKIGKRKDKCKVFYSRRQFDKAMGIESELEPEYYTMPEAMALYNMTRDRFPITSGHMTFQEVMRAGM